MIKILELPIEQDLAPLYEYLRGHGVPLRIIESSGQQEIWVPDDRFRELTLELYQRYQTDPQVRRKLSQWQSEDKDSSRKDSAPNLAGWILSVGKTPVIWAGLIGMALVAVLADIHLFGQEFLFTLFFADLRLSDYATFDERMTMFWKTLSDGHYWRLLTPVFLHGGAMHLIFNSLWFWYLGIRIESQEGSTATLLLVLFTGVGSNFAQYLVSGPAFGGMSGVVYGFFGYVGWRMVFAPRPGLMIPPAILAFALVWLLLGYTGLKLMPGQGEMANTAHSMGLVLGILFAWLSRQSDKSRG